MTSDGGFIEDLLNEEDQDIYAESPRGEEPSSVKMSKPDSSRDLRRRDLNSEGNGFHSHDLARQDQVDFKSQHQANQQQLAHPPQQEQRERAKYFIIRSGNMENVALSYEQGAWATQLRNEPKLIEAFHTADNVYLIFSVNQSGHFQGYGRMTTLPGKLGRNMPWSGAHNVGKSFGVEWECWSELPYEKTVDLRNPWNENKQVKISRDAQELPVDIGDELISRMQACAKRKGPPPRQHRPAPPNKPAGHRSGFGPNNHRAPRGPGGNFDMYMERPMGRGGMMDGYDMGMDGPMGRMGPMGPGMGHIGMGPGMGHMGMRPMMGGPGMGPGDGPMMDMMGPGMGMGPMMDGPMRPGMMMDSMNMRRNMGMNSMHMHGPPAGPPPRNHSPGTYNRPDNMMPGSSRMHGPANGGPYPPQHRGGGPSYPASDLREDHVRRDRSPSPRRERGRSPSRRHSRSHSRGRLHSHSRSRSRSLSRGRAPNLMEMSYDEYLEHYKKVQRRMREMQEMKMTSQNNVGGSSSMMGSNMFGGMMSMSGMNPMMGAGMNQMMGGGMGAGMVPNMGMYNNMGGGMMNRSGIMSESEYVKLCQRYFASHGRPCPPEDKLRTYYRDMKAQWERHMQQRA